MSFPNLPQSLPEVGFIRQAQLIPAIVPFSNATLWRKVKDGPFPAPVKLSSRVTAWDVRQVRQWIDACAIDAGNAMRDDAGVWHDVAKAPATDPTKGSKAGRQAVVVDEGQVVATRLDATDEAKDLLVPVWPNGEMLVRHSFTDMRARVDGKGQQGSGGKGRWRLFVSAFAFR